MSRPIVFRFLSKSTKTAGQDLISSNRHDAGSGAEPPEAWCFAQAEEVLLDLQQRSGRHTGQTFPRRAE
eukprot:10002591-Heterocapsa_arctica.AAC.1